MVCLTSTTILGALVWHLWWSRLRTESHEFTVYTSISQIQHVYLPSTSLKCRDPDWSSPCRYCTHVLSHQYYQQMCTCVGIRIRQLLEFMIIFLYFNTFMLSTSAKLLQSLSYAGIKSTQVPHTYSVWQPLPSYVYLCRNRHPQTIPIYEYIPVLQDFTDLACLSSVNQLASQRYGLVKSTKVSHTYIVSQPLPADVHLCRNRHLTDSNLRFYSSISPLLCSQLLEKCFNHSAMPESSLHMYPTHTLSLNH